MTEEQNNKRADAWRFIQAHPQFTVPELSNAIEMDLEQCRTTVNRWVKQNYLRHIGSPGVPGRPKRFAMVPGSQPRIGKGGNPGDLIRNQKTKTGRQKMWNSMKISRVFTADSLCITAGVCKKQRMNLSGNWSLLVMCLLLKGLIPENQTMKSKVNQAVTG